MLGTQTTTFGRIEFISSLKPNELQTARGIRAEVDDVVSAEGAPVEVGPLREATTREEFFEAISSITQQAESDGKGVVLQIDAHGAEDGSGIVLSSGEAIAWSELRPFAEKLNLATKMNLIVVLSLCHGARFVEEVVPIEKAPCWALAGPTGEVSAGLMVDGLKAFYRTLIGTKDGDRAVAELNKHVDPNDERFYFSTAERVFGTIYRAYLRENFPDDKAIADYARKRHRKWKKEGIRDLPSIGRIKRGVKAGNRDFFVESKQKFFMLDLFPENADRFGIELEDVTRDL